jgi:hypothetical protein
MDGEYPLHDYVVRTERKDYTSMRPIHQICLSQERLIMAKMSYILERLCIPRRLISIRNDGASIQPGRAWERAKAALTVTYGDLTRLGAFEPLRRAVAPKLERESTSETLVFRIKDTKVVQGVDGAVEVALSPDQPGGQLRVSEDEPFELEDLRWTVECEPEYSGRRQGGGWVTRRPTPSPLHSDSGEGPPHGSWRVPLCTSWGSGAPGFWPPHFDLCTKPPAETGRGVWRGVSGGLKGPWVLLPPAP